MVVQPHHGTAGKFEPHLKTWLTFKMYMKEMFGQANPMHAATHHGTGIYHNLPPSNWVELTKRDRFTMGLHSEIQDCQTDFLVIWNRRRWNLMH
jgi:hypothetical protein